MNRIAEALLNNILNYELPEQSDSYCNKLFQYSKQFPQVHIKIESDLKKIKQQYVAICGAIANKAPKNMLVITLFAANEQLMRAYSKIDSDIPRLHALWFSDVLNSIQEDSNFKFNWGNVTICFVLAFVFIKCVFK